MVRLSAKPLVAATPDMTIRPYDAEDFEVLMYFARQHTPQRLIPQGQRKFLKTFVWKVLNQQKVYPRDLELVRLIRNRWIEHRPDEFLFLAYIPCGPMGLAIDQGGTDILIAAESVNQTISLNGQRIDGAKCLAGQGVVLLSIMPLLAASRSGNVYLRIHSKTLIARGVETMHVPRTPLRRYRTSDGVELEPPESNE